MKGIYKGKYLIGLYNKPEVAGNDDTVAIFDNVRELAAYIGKSVHATMNIATRRFAKKHGDIVVDGVTLDLCFIKAA